MKGIILAGGKATRLRPLTLVACKQLLPVYDRPMVYYPIQTLTNSGIKDILVITSPEYYPQFTNLLGDGSQLGANISYQVQTQPRGLADAFILGETFIAGGPVAMVLGDNIFDDGFSADIKNFQDGALVFAKQVSDPNRYGVVEFDKNHHAISIEEKPQHPKSNYAVVGLYVYDNNVVEYAKNLKPSARGEIEITDLNNIYLKAGKLQVKTFSGYWQDAGTFDSLLEANNYMAKKHHGDHKP